MAGTDEALSHTGSKARQIQRRREIVKRLRFREQQSPSEIVERLKSAHGIVTTATTVWRDVKVIEREFAAVARDFDAFVEIGKDVERYEVLSTRALRAALRTDDDGDRARLLKVSIHALNSKVELLQTCGLLPRDLGTLRLQRGRPSERIPTGVELQELFANIVIRPNEVETEAERAWLFGDAASSNAAALDAGEEEH